MHTATRQFARRDVLAAIAMIAAWTLFLAWLVYASAAQERAQTHELMLGYSRALFSEIVVARQWNANHGGVYVFADENTPPNPWLDDPERDIVLPDGRMLTKINPAYMTRQISEIASENERVHFHITSLNPLRRANSPDQWEAAALEAFERDAPETFELVDLGEERVFRYMAPLMVNEACLPCHAQQGYEIGQVRGGISVTLPAEHSLGLMRQVSRMNTLAYALIWVLGVAAILAIFHYYTRRRMAAEAANEAKNRFLAVMSHEMRTPLNGLLGMLQLLKGAPLDEEHEEHLGYAMKAGRGLLALISDILDFSNIEAGKMDIQTEVVSLQSLAGSVVALFRQPCADKGVGLALAVHPETPEYAVTDPRRLRQILFNLLGNAVKFTESGSISLSVRPTSPPPAEGGPMELAFAVKDTGVGIAPEHQETIFQPFTQVEDGANRRFGGSGLGLSVVKRLVEGMGGQVSVTSARGEGTEMSFTLPVLVTRGSRSAQ